MNRTLILDHACYVGDQHNKILCYRFVFDLLGYAPKTITLQLSTTPTKKSIPCTYVSRNSVEIHKSNNEQINRHWVGTVRYAFSGLCDLIESLKLPESKKFYIVIEALLPAK